MELKTARLTLLIDPAKKVAFEQLCAQQDLTPSQVVRQLIRDYLSAHGMNYVPSGTPASAGAEPPPGSTRPAKAVTASPSKAPARRR